MITPYHHIELNGVKYRLAESVEGEHYVEGGEPLRPPNSQVVQGSSQTQFQMRPDTLSWLIDSWAGGGGQVRFDPQNPDRMRVLHNVDAFTKVGALRPGWGKVKVEASIDTAGMRGFVRRGAPEVGVNGELNRVDPNFNVDRFDTATESWVAVDTGNLTSVSDICYDPHRGGIFGIASNTISLWDPPGTSTWKSDATIGNSGPLGVVGDYLYFRLDDTGGFAGAVQHIGELTALVSGGTISTYYSTTGFIRDIAFTQNRLYIAEQRGSVAFIYEGVPRTAAGPGSVTLLASLEDIQVTELLFVAGLLYLGTGDGSIYYLRPGAEYGIVLHPETLHDTLETEQGAAEVRFAPYSFDEFFVYGAALQNVTVDEGAFYMLDRITGAWQVFSVFDNVIDDDVAASSTIAASSSRERNTVLWGNYLMTNEKADLSSIGKWALTPWHNFGIVDDKQLFSVRVQHNMQTTWSLKVYARKDGDDAAETLIGTIAGTGAIATTAVIPPSEFSFSQISLRLVFEQTAAAATDIPFVYSVEVRASVVTPQKVWHLLLDCADDGTGVTPSISGTRKIINVRSVGDGGAPVTFKNGYDSPDPNTFNTHTVVVDSYQINQERSGEGVSRVTLREVA